MSWGSQPYSQRPESLRNSSPSPKCQARKPTSRAASSPSFSTDYQIAQFSPNPFPPSHSQPDEDVWLDQQHQIYQAQSSSRYIHESGLVIPIARTKPAARASASSTSSSHRRQSPNIKMPPKRHSSLSDSTSTPNKKVPKTEPTNPAEFSESVKKKLQTSSRTGQACDRCKVRVSRRLENGTS
jgi:hypothetical protein